MNWVKIDNQFPDHHKVLEAGALAAWLHVCALCYCSRTLSDGVVPKRIVPRLAEVPKPMKLAETLVAVGLWKEQGNAFVIHDYLSYQRSREQINDERRTSRERQKLSRRDKTQRSPEVRVPDTDVDTDTPPFPLTEGETSHRDNLNPRAKGTNPRALADKAKTTDKLRKQAIPQPVVDANGSTYVLVNGEFVEQ